MEGTGAKMRHVKIRSMKDADRSGIRELIKEALKERRRAFNLYRSTDGDVNCEGDLTVFFQIVTAGQVSNLVCVLRTSAEFHAGYCTRCMKGLRQVWAVRRWT